MTATTDRDEDDDPANDGRRVDPSPSERSRAQSPSCARSRARERNQKRGAPALTLDEIGAQWAVDELVALKENRDRHGASQSGRGESR